MYWLTDSFEIHNNNNSSLYQHILCAEPTMLFFIHFRMASIFFSILHNCSCIEKIGQYYKSLIMILGTGTNITFKSLVLLVGAFTAEVVEGENGMLKPVRDV